VRRDLIYEAMLYGYGSLLAKYGRLSRGLMVRELGDAILRYLSAQGYASRRAQRLWRPQSSKTPRLPTAVSGMMRAQVVRVIDGDTVEVCIGERTD
jgi:hypothetical protein